MAGRTDVVVTTKLRYGEDFYRRIGRMGGKAHRGGGFASMTPEQRAECGRKGGKISRRGSANTKLAE